jgi:hypothetical protein
MSSSLFLACSLLLPDPASPPRASEGDSPPARAHHALVYDAAAEAVLLSAGSTPLDGGRAFQMFDDLWLLDGEAWQPLGSAGDGRSGIRLAFDAARERVVSYGGWVNGRSLGDVRALEGLEWRKLCDAPAPAAEAGFVYDVARARFVAFGGSSERGQVHATTWELDGSTWTEIPGAGPAGRQAFAMVHAADRARTVVFGGMGPTPETLFGDTWEYDGATWKEVASDGPSPRASSGCAYDSKRGLVVVFGGSGADGKSLGRHVGVGRQGVEAARRVGPAGARDGRARLRREARPHRAVRRAARLAERRRRHVGVGRRDLDDARVSAPRGRGAHRATFAA